MIERFDTTGATHTMQCNTRQRLSIMSELAQPARPLTPQTRTINVRVPVSVFNRLDELATATARTKSFVTVEALSSYLDAQSWQVQEVMSAIEEMDRGEFATDVEVNAVFAKYGA
jgi:RHH-type transcriptional regulator, rel operon repressor / antitoxin RelB